MKKSSIINYIQQFIIQHYDNYIGNELAREEATKLLADLESFGMMPPWKDDDKFCMCSTSGICPGCLPQNFISTWDKE